MVTPRWLEPVRSVLVLGHAGLADPLLGAAYAQAVLRWGPSLAAAYSAAATRHPSREAVIDDEGAMTFAGLDAWTSTIAGGLREVVGPAASSAAAPTVGILCRNHRGFVAATIAAAKVGADTVYLNTGFAAPQLREVLRREGVTHLVHDHEFAGVVAGARTRRDRWRVVVADDPDADCSLAGLAASGRPAPHRPRRTSLPVLLTSGTTGTPKGARRGRVPFDLATATGLLGAIPYRTSDVFVVPAPLFHAWGLSQMVLAAALGAPLVTRRQFSTEQVLADVATHRATVLALVPVMLQRIVQATAAETSDTSTLRIVAASGSALTGSLATAWMDRFGDTLYNLYGSTEVGQATVAGPTDLRASPGTAGRVLPGARVEILDEHGSAMPAGSPGRIYVGSSLRFTGYTGGGGKTEVGGLLETGDIGYFDDEARLFVTGRQDDMIVSGGENVFPREVEDLLADHPAVADVAVLGVDDADLGQRLRAVVVRRPGSRLTAQQVREHVRANLARHKVPRDVVFAATIPRNAAGKILRDELR